jgi:hypothetical protein
MVSKVIPDSFCGWPGTEATFGDSRVIHLESCGLLGLTISPISRWAGLVFLSSLRRRDVLFPIAIVANTKQILQEICKTD